MKKEDGWEKEFDWMIYFHRPNHEVYKMVIPGNDEIQGAVALEPRREHVFVHLVESAPHNRQPDQEFMLVGLHLFAYACQRSVELGFEGFVSLVAKTALIRLYLT